MKPDGHDPRQESATEEALAGVRDSLAAVRKIPVAGLDAEKARQIIEAADGLESVERALTHEVEQERE
jgi:hypothetical protein